MLPAMDRVNLATARRSLTLLGLILSLGLSASGCSRLSWRKSSPEPPMLGRVTDTTDIYAMRGKPANSMGSIPVPAVAASGIVAPDTPSAVIEEVGVSPQPAETPSSGGVALQTPTSIESQNSNRLAKASDGVPNASLVLASAERAVPSPSKETSRAAELVADARSVLDSMANYEVALHRQERVNGTLLPEEDVVLAIRREPRAVRLTWPSGSNQGREVLYRADEPNATMHVKMANPALPRLSLPPESPLVMRNSRHPVTEAGFDSIIEALENALKSPGLAYVGLEAAEGLDQPQDCLTQSTPAGDRWRVYFDSKTHLPSLLQVDDPNGQLLERYLFREVRPNLSELAANDAFDPNARWGQPQGLLGRFVRGDAKEPSPTPR